MGAVGDERGVWVDTDLLCFGQSGLPTTGGWGSVAGVTTVPTVVPRLWTNGDINVWLGGVCGTGGVVDP